MQEATLASWDEFQEKIQLLKEAHKGSISGLLFRGHGQSTWPLETTLERDHKSLVLVKNYYHSISEIKPQIETFTDQQWDMPTHSEIEAMTHEYDVLSRELSFGRLPAYTYLAYLRHHGFPSPLLDWTRSAYVAAYFAYRRPSGKGSHVSIYVYCDSPENSKFRSSDAPTIHRFGPNVQTHRRHFLQQSEYTICVQFNGKWLFVPHTHVFARDNRFEVVWQDALWKFDLPVQERQKVLKLLDEFNLNAYSLFGSDESLMETMAFRVLHRDVKSSVEPS